VFVYSEQSQQLSVVLGYVAFIVATIAKYLCMHVPFLTRFGSANTIMIQITKSRSRRLQVFALNWADPSCLHAVDLLARNIESLCVQTQVPANTLYSRTHLLPNLLTLLDTILK
jgi:hypothetical protein